MGDPGYPDDWGSYYSFCGRCGGKTHASGTVECGCGEREDEILAEADRVKGEFEAYYDEGLWKKALGALEELQELLEDLV